MRETREVREAREAREKQQITLLELAAKVIKQNIIDGLKQPDMLDIIEDLADCRAKEIVKSNELLEYNSKIEAFTCEICSDKLYVIKHRNINEAIIYAANNIGEISIVFNDNVVVIGGYVKDFVYWGFSNDYKMYRIRIGEKRHEKKNNNNTVFNDYTC